VKGYKFKNSQQEGQSQIIIRKVIIRRDHLMSLIMVILSLISMNPIIIKSLRDSENECAA
jgi:hypothetical protein